MRPTRTAAVVAAVLLLAATAVDGYGIGNKKVDANGRLLELRFLHNPKTGTSFIISLRNYLDVCKTKDKICSGEHGGNNPTYRFPDHTPIYVESCYGYLEACSKTRYHMRWRQSPRWNYVTLLRRPEAQAVSGYFYTNAILLANNNSAMSVEEYVKNYHNVHMKVGCEEGWRVLPRCLDASSCFVRVVGGHGGRERDVVVPVQARTFVAAAVAHLYFAGVQG